MAGIRLADKMLVHQVHPAKADVDVTAAVVSNLLLWRARPTAALAVRVLLPLAGSAAVLRLAELDALAATRRGRYVRAHMPASAQAVRLAGDAVMGLGARRRSRLLLDRRSGHHRGGLVACGLAGNIQPSMTTATSNNPDHAEADAS